MGVDIDMKKKTVNLLNSPFIKTCSLLNIWSNINNDFKLITDKKLTLYLYEKLNLTQDIKISNISKINWLISHGRDVGFFLDKKNKELIGVPIKTNFFR